MNSFRSPRTFIVFIRRLFAPLHLHVDAVEVGIHGIVRADTLGLNRATNGVSRNAGAVTFNRLNSNRFPQQATLPRMPSIIQSMATLHPFADLSNA
jgi:hypothetical protein